MLLVLSVVLVLIVGQLASHPYEDEYGRPISLNSRSKTSNTGLSPTIPDVKKMTETSRTSGSADIFTVGTFNLLNQTYTEGDGGREWESDRKPEAASQVVDSGASILGVQESSTVANAGDQTQAEDLAAEINAQLSAPSRWQVVDIPAVEGPQILYDSKIHRILGAPMFAPLNYEHISGKSRTMVWGTFERIATGTRFILINGHWAPNSDGGAKKGALRRAETAQIVADLATSLWRATRLPIILTADFNSYTSNKSPRNVLTKAGFPDSRAVADTVINEELDSWHGFDVGMKERRSGEWIDGIHVSAESIRVMTASCFVRFEDGERLPLATPLPSDHNLVTAKLQLASNK